MKKEKLIKYCCLLTKHPVVAQYLLPVKGY